MNRFAITLLAIVCTTVAYALQKVECVGTAVQLVDKGDTLLFFDGYPELKCTSGPIDWYYEDGSICQQNSQFVSPQSGRGVHAVGLGTDEWCYVFNYLDYRPTLDSLLVEADCDSVSGTTLVLYGQVPAIEYIDRNARTRSYARTCKIAHTDVEWAGEEWQDVPVETSVALRTTTPALYVLPAFYRSTSFVLRTDTIALGLYGVEDSVVSEWMVPVAVKMMPNSVTTTRGDAFENENERPIQETTLSGSAPLNILFKCNPTEVGEHFEWKIYKGSALLTTRTDETIRYAFEDYGNYVVSGRAYSNGCNCLDPHTEGCTRDSVRFEIGVSESQLLVPNVFTPNGDGVNDEFRVLYRSIRDYHICIFDRWGHKVYESTDPSRGWDGTVGGRPVSVGAYFYVIRALGNDAPKDASFGTKLSYKQKRKKDSSSLIGIYRLSGDINLIR